MESLSYHFGFILEQTLGHVTHAMNLQHYISRDATVQSEWGLPAWDRDGWLSHIPVYRSNWTLQAGLATRKVLPDLNRRHRMDALFFHTQVTAVLSPDWLKRIPSIVSLDATPRQYDRLGAFYEHRMGPAWLEGWKWRLNRSCFRLARHIVTWSEWTARGLVEEYDVLDNKISVIPPGVDTLAWARPDYQRDTTGPVRILFVGGSLERKGGMLLLEAFRCLRDQFSSPQDPSIELHLVTRDAVAPEPGVFLYQQMQPNSQPLKELFFQSDIFCLPTLGDCLPMVLSEAGAAGLPLVSTQLAAIPEIILDGETGFLIKPGDLEDLVGILRQLILNPDLRHRLGQQAQEMVRQRYDAGQNATMLLDLMKQISDASHAERKLQ